MTEDEAAIAIGLKITRLKREGDHMLAIEHHDGRGWIRQVVMIPKSQTLDDEATAVRAANTLKEWLMEMRPGAFA